MTGSPWVVQTRVGVSQGELRVDYGVLGANLFSRRLRAESVVRVYRSRDLVDTVKIEAREGAIYLPFLGKSADGVVAQLVARIGATE